MKRLIIQSNCRLERDLPARYDEAGVKMRERIKWDIREAIIGAENFFPKHAIIATWKNVSFVGGFNALETVRICVSHFKKWLKKCIFLCVYLYCNIWILDVLQTNTFQIVIVTDEVRTYAMFNYAHLGWSTHAEAGGDTNTGQGGVPAFVRPFLFGRRRVFLTVSI